MSIDLLKNTQQNLGYPPLQKVDPNVQDVPMDPTVPTQARLGQAAIPSVLIALYKYSKTDDGAAIVACEKKSPNWVNILFGDNRQAAVSSIASYAAYRDDDVEKKMNEIAIEAVHLLNEHVKVDNKIKSIEQLVAAERDNILLYLPAVLNMGKILGDETIDDRTNKMEGPISTLMHKIENTFSSAG